MITGGSTPAGQHNQDRYHACSRGNLHKGKAAPAGVPWHHSQVLLDQVWLLGSVRNEAGQGPSWGLAYTKAKPVMEKSNTTRNSKVAWSLA